MRPTDPSTPLSSLLAERAWLQALARRLVRDENAADDLAQETWLAALRRAPGKLTSARAWLAAVLRNALRDRRRAETSRARREFAAARPEASDGVDVVARADAHLRLAQAVHDLAEPYRTTVLLRYFDGLEVAEIAARLGTSQDAVRMRLRRAIAQLRGQLGDDDRRAWAALLLARRPAPTAVAAAAIGGALVMKKVLAVAVLLVLFAGGWFALRPPDESRAARETAERTVAADSPSAQAHARIRAGEPAATAPVPTPADADVPGPRITGRVIDPDGRPLAGARVISLPDDVHASIAADAAGTKGSRTFRATAGTDGRFVLRLDAGAPSAIVFADAPGRSPASRVDVRPGDDVTLTLERTTSLSGTVTDIDGAPVAGATVFVRDLVLAVQVVRSATSGGDGRYRVDDVARRAIGAFHCRWIEVTAAGFAPLLLEENTFAATAETRDLVLVRGARVAGRVLDAESGAPLAGARVVLMSIEGMQSFMVGSAWWSNPWGGRTLAETVAGEDGSYVFEHVPSQGFHPSASHNSSFGGGLALGHVGAWKDGWVYASGEVPLRASGATIDVDLRLWPAAAIEGRAVLADGSPAAEASVSATVEGRSEGLYPPPTSSDASRYVPWTTAGADGSFVVRGIRATRSAATTVQVQARRKSPEWSQDPDATATVELRAGETKPLTLTLGAHDVPSIVLAVRDAGGSPVWGATVGRGGEFAGTTRRTGADGRVMLWFDSLARSTRPTQEMEFVVRARGFATTSVKATPAVGAAEIPVTLPPGSRVAGRVRWDDGTPAAGVTVQAANAAVAVGDAFPTDAAGASAGARRGGTALVILADARVAADGTFELADLPDAPCHVSAMTYSSRDRVPGMPPRPIRDTRADVPPGTSDLAFVLPKEAATPSQTLTGTIRDAATGRAIPSATICALREDAAHNGEMTAPGKFAVAGVPAGTWTLSAEVPGYLPCEIPQIEVTADAVPAPFEMLLDRGATLKGFVHAAAGTLPEGGTLWFRRVAAHGQGRTDPSARVASDGSFEATGFPRGEFGVTFFVGNPWQQGNTPLLPADGKPVTVSDAHAAVAVDLTLVPSGTLQVTVSDPRLPPIPHIGRPATAEQTTFGAAAGTEVRDASGALVASQTGLAENFCGVAGLLYVLPGNYVVRLSFPGEAARERRVEVRAATLTRVVFKPD